MAATTEQQNMVGPVLMTAPTSRFGSRGLAVMRKQFGGHAEKPAGG